MFHSCVLLVVGSCGGGVGQSVGYHWLCVGRAVYSHGCLLLSGWSACQFDGWGVVGGGCSARSSLCWMWVVSALYGKVVRPSQKARAVVVLLHPQ